MPHFITAILFLCSLSTPDLFPEATIEYLGRNCFEITSRDQPIDSVVIIGTRRSRNTLNVLHKSYDGRTVVVDNWMMYRSRGDKRFYLEIKTLGVTPYADRLIYLTVRNPYKRGM